MKSVILFTVLLFIIQFVRSQQVGIGTTTPSARLDIKRPGGDTPTLNIRGTNFISHFHFGSTEDTYIRGGTFGSNVIINDLTGGNVGIGTSSPGFQLSFAPNTGDKISLYGSSGPHYGFGIQPYLFQIHTDAPSADIAFGSGSSLSFTETFRIKGNGNVGIGVNDPSYKLDIGGRMRIRSGGGSAGLYLNNNTNNASPGFIGMQDDNHIGLWGSGAGWGFTMNTDNGALKVNGSEGTDKQVLASSGSSSSWKTLGSLIQTYYRYAGGLYVYEGSVSSTNQRVVFSSLTHTITVSTKSRLIISAVVEGTNGGCFGCGDRHVYIDVRVNGAEAGGDIYHGVMNLAVPNGALVDATISNYFWDVNPGTYTVEIIGKGTDAVGLYSKYSTVIVLPID